MAEKTLAPRRYQRAVVSLAVEYSQGGNREAARALTLSATGLLIETKTPLPLSERLKVAFKVPGSEELIQADAEVVWVNRYSADYPYGMAVKFLGLGDEAIQTIDAYVRKVRESARISQREHLVAIPD
ncbi:MAG TPA: PilZ domain-containing protein [Syntrophobacteria bacterium]|nr:PilZ domain-containing protein [Syntrophobacteria bacterium]